MSKHDVQQNVFDILRTLRDAEGLKKLFWQELNYERANKPLSTRGWSKEIKETLDGDPLLLATGGEDGDFHVIYCRLAADALRRGHERPIISQLLGDHPYVLFVFSSHAQDAWHFINVKYGETVEKRRLMRRITVRPGDGLRTAAERLAMLDLRSMGTDLFGLSPLAIQNCHDEAFNVDKVTEAFYREIANWYFWARQCPEVVFPKDVEDDAQRSLFLIRLLTRLVFCWFLREKRNPTTGEGLIPDRLFDARQVKALLKDFSPESCTYYTAILQNLFFATLNTEMDPPGQPTVRRFLNEGDGQRSDEHMVHQLWRHDRQLRDPAALEALLRGIPFLNGGLFECLDDRVQKGNSPYTVEVRLDGFATDPKKQPKLPNGLFFGPPQTVDLSKAYGDDSHRRESVSPLIEILNRYNFTLTENTPLDQEVALDPELLGHVFENLLASFNPETGTVARNATGSFYTPRVVVDWMVDQALLVYLKSHLVDVSDSSDKKLRQLLSWEEAGHEFKPAEADTLIDAIDRLKVLDPACGSGAFPMGMLQKLVHVLKKLDPKNEGWRQRQADAASRIESGPARDEALKAIERAFARDNDDYGRKLYLIENCLYGVDIQPIAVQIAKLRFFIALVVDQSIDPKAANYGILPLPNLETKVVAANTLLGLHRGQLLLGATEVKRLESELQRVRHDYFTARSYKRKKDLRKEDKRLCDELSQALASSGECTPYDARRLAGWNPYDTNTAAAFFDPGWMFGLASTNHDGVFDIVIGNPPYVRQEELKNQSVVGSDGKARPLKDALKGQYECFTGTADLYVYFFERSIQLLHTGGVLSFITSNKYFRAAYGERLRTYLAHVTRPHAILDFGDAPVFTAIAYPAIVVTQKTRKLELGQLPKSVDADGGQSRVMTWAPGPEISEFPELFERRSFALACRDLKPDGWRIENTNGLRFLERLRKAGIPLRDFVGIRVFRGITTGFNNAFVVDALTRDRLIAQHKSSEELLMPYLRGKDIKRWRNEAENLWIIFTRRGCDINKHPAIHEHLTAFKKRLTPGTSEGRKAGTYKWYEIQDDIAYWQEFRKCKVISTKISIRPTFSVDSDGFFLGNTSYFIPAGNKALFITALLNSAVFFGYAKRVFVGKQGGWYEVQPQGLEQFPIPPATPAQQKELESLVNRILAAKKADPAADVAALEREIDTRVYKLYGLTQDEIRIVEGAQYNC